jgi:hypothetical protein
MKLSGYEYMSFWCVLNHQNDVQQAVKCFFEVAEWILMVLKKDG